MNAWERNDSRPALSEVVGEHGGHDVTPGHQEGPVAVLHPVLQLEGDVREGVEGSLATTERVQLAPDGEMGGEEVVDVSVVRPLTQIIVERPEVQHAGQLQEVGEVVRV